VDEVREYTAPIEGVAQGGGPVRLGRDTVRLASAWLTGWCASRGFEAPVPTGGGYWVYPREDGRERELLWPDPHQPIEPDLLATIGASSVPSWVTVATTDVSSTQGLLADRGVVPAGWPEWLMASELATGTNGDCPGGCTPSIGRVDDVFVGEVRGSAGDLVASGRMALTEDGFAVADRIVTEEGYRRQGFGRWLMTELGSAARDAGATHGLLIASVEGHLLYEAMSWTSVCDVVIARNTSAMA